MIDLEFLPTETGKSAHAARQHRYRAAHPAYRELQNRSRSRDPVLRAVVAVDGEGETRDDGSHVYTLLSASDGSSVASDDGLDSETCLRFLLGFAGKFVVGFAFSYDVNMIVADLPRVKLYELHRKRVTYWQGNAGRYRLQYTPRKSFSVSEMVNKTAVRTTVIWDTFGFYQTSFTKALREWRIGTDDEIGFLEGMKSRRSDFANVDGDAIGRYNDLECTLLVRLTEALRDTLIACELRPSRWDGAGAVAGTMLRRHGIKDHLGGEHPPEVLSAYFGGRIQVCQLGEIPGPIHNYDVNSAYPAACLALPSLNGRWRRATAYEPAPWAIWRCRWRFQEPRSPTSRLPAAWSPILTPFPFRDTEKNVHYPLVGEGWYWSPLVDLARQHWTFDVLEGWIYEPFTTIKPFDFIRDYYARRREYKRSGDPRHIVVKLGLNSLYGKTAQGVGWRDSVPAYRSYAWAGLITATTQAALLRAALQKPAAVIAFATDGLYSREPLDVPTGSALGEWEYTTYDRMVVFQPGLYILTENGVDQHRTRGYAPRELDWDELCRRWRQGQCFATYDFTVNRFLTLGVAIQEHRFRQWRRWVDESRTLNLRPASGFPGDPVAEHAIRWLPDFTVKGCEISQPYTPKRTQYDLAQALRLATELEQPDPIL